jgi:hypothetical protein
LECSDLSELWYSATCRRRRLYECASYVMNDCADRSTNTKAVTGYRTAMWMSVKPFE